MNRPTARAGVIVMVVVVLAGGAVLLARRSTGAGTSRHDASATSLAAVTRGPLSKQMQLTGALGYAGSYAVLGPAHGTVTWLPAVGQVVRQGQVLYQVDGAPAVLLYGSTPAYRTLAEGVTGVDVAQLNRALVALGYLRRSDVDGAWSRFRSATRAGVQVLQKHLGVPRSGALAVGQVVFLPTAARVTALPAGLGAPATGPVLRATSTTPVVSVALAADQQSAVKAGDRVTITLPDNRTTPGTVTSVGTVAVATATGQDSTPTVPVTIRPTDPTATAGWDQAPVLVAITTATVPDALAVPVYALLARSGGGYAVEVADPDGARHLVTVSPGLFDDATGLVQVTGAGLAAGQHVVVPAS